MACPCLEEPVDVEATVCRAVRNVTGPPKEEVHRIAGEFDGYLLGDRGYPCQRYLLTPYPDPDPELGPQQHYNLAHCRTQARVEMTIGILEARFQCLCSGMCGSPQH
ncbi:hypothetical protein JOB18_042907 [Solea senegalensis]|uniref:DDE Tnp4 domain-containing protein n=1 Tax=Solea senegalensis TaxID=28829 RepID=A0AAV6TAS1_SOLSE|nr:hypothetical protein JOB18_042907 [Solea senegalensis]